MTSHINDSKKEVRKFGIMFAVIAAAVGGYLFYKELDAWKYLAGASGFFLTTGLFIYPVLRPIYVGWMKFAFALGWFNTRLLLGLFFYLIMTPVGFLMRLFGKDFLDLKIDRSSNSYWRLREQAPFDPKRVERLF